ncbi:MAG: transcriptional repressor [Candidatus Eisenbacteria bacterium]
MDEPDKRRRLAALESCCRDRGVPCTSRRRIILDTVLDLNDHPSADQVFEAVSRRRAGISRATVYRTLETLAELALITKACHPGRVVRYDPRVDLHHHLVCLRCDKVIDIFDGRLDALPSPDTSAHGFEVTDHRVQFRGLCGDCAGKKAKSPEGG